MQCSRLSECVAAIYDENANTCYLRSSLVEITKSEGSGISVLHVLCAEKEIEVTFSSSNVIDMRFCIQSFYELFVDEPAYVICFCI